ncbi:MAG TPA: tetraacyldisaccharide 4'-kinase [Gemmatimonadales bacterium]
MMRFWTSRSLWAQAGRLALLPPALVFQITATARTNAYRSGWLHRSRLPLPSIGVGGLAVGGAGKTPVAGWIASWYAERGVRPGILLRGYGGDEGEVHRLAVGAAVVVEDPDRLRGAHRAHAGGAEVLVLDDAFQRLDVRCDVAMVLVSAESVRAARWRVPAGPWREGWRSLRRADLVVVTVKSAGGGVVAEAVQEARAASGRDVAVARLEPGPLRGAMTGCPYREGLLAGAHVLVVAGVADPDAFAAQIGRQAGRVSLVRKGDHHAYTPRDVRRVLSAAEKVDYVVVTAKDATKLRRLWPASAAEPVVAELTIKWESGRATVERRLEQVIRASRHPNAVNFHVTGHPVEAGASAHEQS